MSLTLQHRPADIIRYMMIGKGLGTDPPASGVYGAWPIFCSSEPDAPDSVITTYDTTPQSDGRSMIDGEYYQHYGIQIRIRDLRSDSGWAKAAEIFRQFAENTYNVHLAIGSNTYKVCAMNSKGGIIQLAKEFPTDELNIFTINYISALYRVT